MFDVLDGGVKLRLDVGQDFGRVGAHVEAEAKLAGDGGHSVDTGIGVEASEGDGHLPSRVFIVLPNAVERHGDVCRGHHRVMPEFSGRADVIMASEYSRIRISEVAWNRGAEPKRDIRLDEARRLFDMHLEKSMDSGGVEVTLATAQRVRVAAALGDMIGKAAAGIHAHDIDRPARKRTKGAAATNVRYLEPDALFGAYGHDGDVARGRQTHSFDCRNGGQSSHHACCAIKIAAMRHAIEMRAGDHRRQRAVAPRQRHVSVGCGIGANLESEIPGAS